MGVERKNMRDVLVRPYDDHAPPRSIDAPQVEDILARLFRSGQNIFS